jgi:hypothetical protein
MELKNISRLKSSFVTREVGNELVLVPLSSNVSTMDELFTMNETGRFIWENLTETTTIDALVGKMTQEFEVDAATAKKDIEQFLSKMSQLERQLT